MIRRSPSAAAFALAFVTVNCAWVTDLRSRGYTLEEGGAKAFGCTSAADCGGLGICCLTSLSTMEAACQTSCTALPVVGSVQICSSDAECAAGMCVPESCLSNTASVCGTISCGGSIEADAAAGPDTSVSTVITPIDASATTSD